MKLSYLWRGLPGHPLHPPLTDATIGIYTFATLAGFVEVVGITNQNGAIGWWLALVAGLIVTVPTALAGFADWLTITWRSELWWTATWHMLSMVTATVFFHGMRVLNLVEETAKRAMAPVPHTEKEMAEGPYPAAEKPSLFRGSV